MKIINKLLLSLSLLSLAGCAGDDLFQDVAGPIGDGQATFTISTDSSQIGVITRGEETEPVITNMRWLVADTEGNIIPHYYGRLENQFTKLTLEGLQYGDYNLLFLATLSESENEAVEEPYTFSDPWLVNQNEGSPLDGLYCYKKLPFTIGKGSNNFNVILEHSVARVYVDLEMPNLSQWRFIKKVSVTFNEEIPASLDAGGTYSGTHIVKDYDIYDPSGVFTFTTFPSDTPVSGYVEIESSRDNGDDFVQRYDFSDLNLEAGKITTINLDYRHPERESGLLYVAKQEQWRYDIGTMLLPDEPREVFYNNNERWFYTDEPLQVFLRNDGKLGVRYYSPFTLKDVKVKACFNKVSPEWVNLAVIEEVNPFEEAFFTLPITEHDCVFDGESGRKVRIPAIPDLTPGDVSLKFEWDKDDPFMKKIAEIKLHWFIRFCAFGADEGHAYWRHMDATLCRHAASCAYNMTYMFSTQEFLDELKQWDGKLIHCGTPVVIDNIVAGINRHGGLNMGKVEGSFVVGLGGGQTFGMADWCYTGFYPDTTPVGANPHNIARDTMFHEFAHCLGYGHDGNMTYGNAWTVLCSKVLVDLGHAQRLPVSNITDVTSLAAK